MSYLHPEKLKQAKRTYEDIKRFYLQAGKTVEDWGEVTRDPRKFNRVWRQMLRLPRDDSPPPVSYEL